MVTEKGMLDVNPSGAKNSQAIDVSFHSLASELVTGAKFEGSDRDVILTMKALDEKMYTHSSTGIQ